jgi:hypothetical protein
MLNKKFLGGLAGLLLAGLAFAPKANAAGIESVTFNSTTNNASIVWDASCWATQYMIQAGTSVNGSVTTVNDYVDQGSNTTVTANANPHYHFMNWKNLPTGANTNVNPTTFVVNDGYTNIIANFAIDTYTVTVSSAYGTIAPSATNVVPYGSSFTATVTPTNTIIPGRSRAVLRNPPKVTGHNFVQP